MTYFNTLLLFLAVAPVITVADDRPPNIVFILCDNLGYGDVGCYGSTVHQTPRIDRLSAEGVRLTSFYSASGVCTPSRAALMTGCYPRRVGLDLTQPDGHVLRPVSPNGLHPNEVTIAETLKRAGYATICIGKWHLGDQPVFLPTQQGFDEWFGVPYSDDMTPRTGKNWPDLPLMKNDIVIEAPVNRDLLTQRYTAAAVQFIRQHRTKPFFLYLPHAMPGSTRAPFASDAFKNTSANGPYGDSVLELDWSTGEILDALDDEGIAEQTLVIWTSDNGAPRRNPPQGSNAPLGGWGYSVNEGGMRVPCIVRWPNRIPADSNSDALTTMMDWLPTFSALTGQVLDPVHPIDGKNISDVLLHPDSATSPHQAFLYYDRNMLKALRTGKWKLFAAGKSEENPVPARLYNLETDPGEKFNVAADHPSIVERLTRLALSTAKDLGEGDARGSGIRPVGRVEDPQPQLLPDQ